MPFQSDKQRKAMYAAAEGRSTVGIPQQAAKSFIKHSTGEKSKLKDVMTERARRKQKRG